jgi:hypothetical protein
MLVVIDVLIFVGTVCLLLAVPQKLLSRVVLVVFLVAVPRGPRHRLRVDPHLDGAGLAACRVLQAPSDPG